MTLHIFNPSHDEAMAIDTASYLGSKAAQTLERDLFDLPLLWAEAGDACWQKGVAIDWKHVSRIAPWGWNKAIVHQLQKAGAPPFLLPTAAQLAAIRRLSNRHTAIRLLKALKTRRKGAYADCESLYCESIDAAKRTQKEMQERGKRIIYKAPWSCSGRGVFRADEVHANERVARILKQQGGIVMEAEWEKEQDFAMLFDYEEGKLQYLGISLFDTDEKGAYKGNLIDTQSELLTRLAGTQSDLATRLESLRQDIESCLPPLLGTDYSGALGIDMMRRGNLVHPCVEINLRRTMGRVAFDLAQTLPAHSSLPARFALQFKDKRMTYAIKPLKKNEKL